MSNSSERKGGQTRAARATSVDGAEDSTVHLAIDARGVATVTLARPERHNAFDDGMIRTLAAHFHQLASREDVRVVVLAATGSSFSAGADLGYMRRMADYDYGHNLQDAEALAEMLWALYSLPQPTIARVQGAAFGGALGLISCCDMAIASRSARFALSEVRIGLIPATIAPYVVRAIGERAARRYVLTGETFDAQRAEAIGLLSEVVEDAALDEAVSTRCAVLLDNGPEAVRLAKDLIRDVAGVPIDAALRADTCARIAHTRVSKEGQEGLAAFLDKRSPAWRRA